MGEIEKKIKMKKEMLDIVLSILDTELKYREEGTRCNYEIVGTHEYTDADTGEVKTRNEWGYAPKETLSEHDEIVLEAVEKIKEALLKLI